MSTTAVRSPSLSSSYVPRSRPASPALPPSYVPRSERADSSRVGSPVQASNMAKERSKSNLRNEIKEDGKQTKVDPKAVKAAHDIVKVSGVDWISLTISCWVLFLLRYPRLFRRAFSRLLSPLRLKPILPNLFRQSANRLLATAIQSVSASILASVRRRQCRPSSDSLTPPHQRAPASAFQAAPASYALFGTNLWSANQRTSGQGIAGARPSASRFPDCMPKHADIQLPCPCSPCQAIRRRTMPHL